MEPGKPGSSEQSHVSIIEKELEVSEIDSCAELSTDWTFWGSHFLIRILDQVEGTSIVHYVYPLRAQ